MTLQTGSDKQRKTRRAFKKANVNGVRLPEPVVRRGRHVLTRHDNGQERCIGCEVCAEVCPAQCITVRGEDNPPEAALTPSRRYAHKFEIDYLRCVQCNLCVESCPTSAIAETGVTAFGFAEPSDARLRKDDLLVPSGAASPVSSWLGAIALASKENS